MTPAGGHLPDHEDRALGPQHLHARGVSVNRAFLVADRQTIEVEPIGLAEKPLLDVLVLVEQGQVVADDGAQARPLVLLEDLMGWHEGQLDPRIAVRQRVEGVEVVHALPAGIPLQDHLLKRPGG